MKSFRRFVFAFCLITFSAISEQSSLEAQQEKSHQAHGHPTITGVIARGAQHATMKFREIAQQPLQERPVAAAPFMPAPGNLPIPPNSPATVERALTAQETEEAATFTQSSPWLSANFAALGDNNTVIPPDVQGAAGPSHLMTTLNTQVRIQNRSGGVISTVSLQSFWSSVGPFTTTTGVFDPRVLYDPYRGRWIHVACADPQDTNSSLVVGVSQTNDPTGNWNLFKIRSDAAKLVWADYPTVGFNRKWIVVQVNMYPIPSGSLNRSHVYVFDKDSLYANTSSKHTLLTLSGEGGTQAPAVTFSNTQDTMFLVKSYQGNQYGLGWLRPYTVTGPVGSEVLTLGSFISTSNPWDWAGAGIWNDFAPQQGSSNKIMNNDDRMQNVIYRNGYLWCAHTIFLPAGGSTRSAVQWWQLTTSGGIVQRGRIDDATGTKFYAFPSICVNKYNDVMIGYSRFSSSQYASANYSFRSAADPINTMRTDTTYKAGEATYYKIGTGTLNRWGDFSHTVIDPTNDIDLWTIQEYAATPFGGSDRWGTWWGQLQPRATFAANPSSLNFGTVPSGGNKTDSVFVKNTGTGTLIIDSVKSDNAQFTASPSGGSIAPSDSQKYSITFTPNTFGTVTGNIVYYHNASGSPDTVAVTGSIAPVITSFLPTTGAVGTSVTINGNGFHPTPTNNIVFFGTAKASVTGGGSTSLTVTVPTGATYAPLTVTSSNLTAYSAAFFNVTFATGSGIIDTASFMTKSDFATGTTPWGLAVGDVDLDGKIDVAVVNSGSNTVSVFRNTSVGSTISFATRIDLTVNDSPRNLAFGDLDGDGRLDIAVVRQSSNSVSVFRNLSTSGSVSFAARQDFTVGSNPFNVAIGEIDGDGKPDVATANTGGSFSILRNTSTIGNISFATKVDVTSGNGTRSIALGDFDGDGKVDATVVSISSSQMIVFRNTSTVGGVTFASGVTYSTGLAPYEVVVADVDIDGKLDIASVDYTSTSVSVFRNTCIVGNISFNSALSFATGNGPSCLAAENLNGDAKADLLASNYTDNTASVLRNTSASISFAGKVDFGTNTNPYGCTSGDMDGDGAPELITANQGNNTMSIVRNRLADSYIITATVIGNGTITPSGSVVVLHGADRAFTFAPDFGYHFDSLLVDGVKVDSLTSYTFYNVTYGHSITAYFTINQYTIMAQNVGNGTITPSGPVTVTHGTNQSFTISANPNYHIDSVVVDGAKTDSTASYTFVNIVTGHTITAYFSIDTYTILATVAGNGWITPSGSVVIPHGSNQSFAFGPNPNATFDSLFVDGFFVDSTSSYTFFNITASHTIHAKFLSSSYTITVVQTDHGTITPGTTDVPHGGNQTFTITPDVGYHVDSVLVDGLRVDSLLSYTFTSVTAPHTLTAYYSINKYMLIVNIIGAGTVTKDPNQPTYDHGASVQLTATPDDHTWSFSGWSDDTASTVNPISILMDGDRDITATFVQDSAYLLPYRSFLPESLALDKDNKGKINKYVKKKPDKVDFELTVTCDSLNITVLHAEFSVAILDTTQFDFGTSPPSTPVNTDGKMKKWDFTFASPLGPDSTVTVFGFGNKGKQQKVSKYYWTRGDGEPVGTKKKLETLSRNALRLPMPNRVNVLYETFFNSGYGAGGMIVGQNRKVTIPDSSKLYGWLQTTKYTDILNTLIKSKTMQMHTDQARGFTVYLTTGKPIVKQQKKLPPDKHNNKLLAELIALKLNVTASAMGITQPGFGELIFDDDSTNPLNGSTVNRIAAIGDSLMMGWYDPLLETKVFPAQEVFDNLYLTVRRIDSAFEGPLDTTHFADSLRFTGMRQLVQVPFLRANPSVIPARIVPVLHPDASKPLAFTLHQNYPNPFNPTTVISYQLSVRSYVTLKVFNLLGQEVVALIDHEELDEGDYEIELDAHDLSSGVYFYRLQAGSFTETRKLLLIK